MEKNSIRTAGKNGVHVYVTDDSVLDPSYDLFTHRSITRAPANNKSFNTDNKIPPLILI